MKSSWIVFILIAFSYTESVKRLKLVNNGYEDLYVVIQEAVPESEELLDRIQVPIVFIYSLTPNPHFHTRGGKGALISLRNISEGQFYNVYTMFAWRSTEKM